MCNNGATLVYEPNPKHKDPFQPGKKGSICPQLEPGVSLRLLRESDEDGSKRFACLDGRAYCAQEHRKGRWHGYPVGFREVPPSIRKKWKKAGLVRRSDIKKHWES